MGFQAKGKMPTVDVAFDATLETPPEHLAPLFTMTDQHDPSDSGAAPHDRYIPALDGLRGIAAILVAGGGRLSLLRSIWWRATIRRGHGCSRTVSWCGSAR